MNERTGLYRSRENTVIAGVCGGIGESLNVDPVVIRFVFVLLFFVGASSLLIYAIMWIVLPEGESSQVSNNSSKHKTMEQKEFSHEPKKNFSPKPKTDGNLVAGLILITLGAIFLIDRFVPRIHFGDLWPLILVAAGAALIFMAYRKPKSNNYEQ